MSHIQVPTYTVRLQNWNVTAKDARSTPNVPRQSYVHRDESEQFPTLPFHRLPSHRRNHVSSVWLQRTVAVAESCWIHADAADTLSGSRNVGQPTARTQYRCRYTVFMLKEINYIRRHTVKTAQTISGIYLIFNSDKLVVVLRNSAVAERPRDYVCCWNLEIQLRGHSRSLEMAIGKLMYGFLFQLYSKTAHCANALVTD